MSSDREGVFAGENPITIAQEWLSLANQTEPEEAGAIALATVDSDGLPNVRMVLLQEIEPDAFVFFTNYNSKKGQELISSGKAAFVLYWKSLHRQVRVRGLVSKEDGPQADIYFASRPKNNRICSCVSNQSEPLGSRRELEEKIEVLTSKYKDGLGEGPPRPLHWGGFRIKPLEIELWMQGKNRLHDRFLWKRQTLDSEWCVQRLNP
eukprot:CFRG4738T1